MKERITQSPPEAAVRASMEHAKGVFLGRIDKRRFDIRKLRNVDLNQEEIETKLQEQTLGSCKEGTHLAALYIKEHFPAEFDRLYVVEEMGPFLHNQNHLWHRYFLTRSRLAGEWFAGSPANHDPSREDSHLNSILRSDSLAGILQKIQLKDGGDWALSTHIEGVQLPDSNVTALGDPNSLNIILFRRASYNNPEAGYTTHIGLDKPSSFA